jgi:putative transposase
MGTSHFSLYYHLVISTIDRKPWLGQDVRPRLYAYFGGIIRRYGGVLLAAGGIEDHCHLLPSLSMTSALSDVVMNLKGASSYWLKKEFPWLFDFGWQTGYFIATVSPNNLTAVRKYIDMQQEHHKTMKYEKEMALLLNNSRYDGLAVNRPKHTDSSEVLQDWTGTEQSKSD